MTVATIALVAIGCGDDTTNGDLGQDLSSTVKTAKATINETGGAQGTVNFEETGSGVHITISLTAVPGDGMHGMHIHATGDCSDSAFDGGTTHHGAAGGHFNPDMVNHGCPPAAPHHAGDLGNITITGGAGTLDLMSSDLTVSAGTKSVVGKAIILHMSADDCMTQPTGNSGGRIGCAVIN
jgi:Cu-Zn family superoxide dismutase